MAAIELEETIVEYPSVAAMDAALEQVAIKEPKAKKAKESKPKKAKEPKPKKVKPKACNVPKRNTKLQSVIWMRYIYDMLKEAEVDITDEIIDAYNNVITFLEAYTAVTILAPSKWERYVSIVPYENIYRGSRGIYINHSNGLSKDERSQFKKDLMEVYDKFYMLVKDKVDPYMANKKKHIETTATLANAKRNILAFHEKVEQYTQSYNATIKSYHDEIRRLQTEVIQMEKILTEIRF